MGCWPMADMIVAFFALAGAVLASLLLRGAGWPWYAWLPAGFLAGVASAALWFGAWFLIRKLTYPAVARKQRQEADTAGTRRG